MIHTFLVDDEAPARDELRYLLEPYSQLHIVGEADNATDAIRLISELKPDLIFLDIHMRGLSGMELATIIPTISPDSHIIFATAYDNYALEAFSHHAVDYLVKPIEEDRLASAIEHITMHFNQSQIASPSEDALSLTPTSDTTNPMLLSYQKLAVEKNGRILLIPLDSIYYITGESGYLDVYSKTGVYKLSKTLSFLQSKYEGTSLFRVHRSYLANLNEVREVLPWFKGTYWLRLPDGLTANSLTDIPVSKSQVKVIKDLLGLS